jgi:hypothetical protein
MRKFHAWSTFTIRSPSSDADFGTFRRGGLVAHESASLGMDAINTLWTDAKNESLGD